MEEPPVGPIGNEGVPVPVPMGPTGVLLTVDVFV